MNSTFFQTWRLTAKHGTNSVS